MSGQKDSGDKTELPTPKRLRDARKKGDVAKSRDVTAAAVTVVWLLLFAFLAGLLATRVAAFADRVVGLAAGDADFAQVLAALTTDAVWLVVLLTAALLVPAAAVGLIAESLQIGPVWTGEKLKLSFDKLNPVEGLKRMFGKDGLVEMVKTLAKAVVVIVVTWLVLRAALPNIASVLWLAEASPLAGTGPRAAATALALTQELTVTLIGWVAAAFIGVAILDRIWTKHSFIKKMMMSRRDIKEEFKSDEGDPHVRQHRKQLHQEWANSNAVGAAGSAAALLVNPTHIAIALDFDPDTCPVPVIAAKAEGPLAAAMRAEAARRSVPIVRAVPAARALWARGEVGEIVPQELFDAVAEVILWARRAKDGQAPMDHDLDAARRPPPRGTKPGWAPGTASGATPSSPAL